MGQITITLPDDLEDQVREAVKTGLHGGISDFVRDAIKNELSRRPTYWERFLIVQALESNKILKKLAGDEDMPSDELIESFRRGYASKYSEANDIVSYGELTRADTDFVYDVLDMYGVLQTSFEASGSSDAKLAKATLFEGFDGNASDGYLGFTNFLVDHDRFTYVKPLDKTPHLNSHSQVNPMYRRMLREYYALRKKKREDFNFKPWSLEEVKRVIDAQIQPENRKDRE